MLIAQITDAHIVEKGTHWLSEPLTKTHERLAQVVSYLNAMHPAPDVVLFTGDAVDDGRREAYEHLVELLSSLKIPYFILPGNHDSREEMRKAFLGKPYMPSTGFLQYVVDDYPVRLIALDTHVEKESLGKICEDRLNWLEKTLNAETSKPTLIFMHHPPVKPGPKSLTGSPVFTLNILKISFEKKITSLESSQAIITTSVCRHSAASPASLLPALLLYTILSTPKLTTSQRWNSKTLPSLFTLGMKASPSSLT